MRECGREGGGCTRGGHGRGVDRSVKQRWVCAVILLTMLLFILGRLLSVHSGQCSQVTTVLSDSIDVLGVCCQGGVHVRVLPLSG